MYMLKKFLYKKPTGAAQETAPGALLFDKDHKTISVGGDRMYPPFVCGGELVPESLTFEGSLAQYVTNSSPSKYRNFLEKFKLTSDYTGFNADKAFWKSTGYGTGEFSVFGLRYCDIANDLVDYCVQQYSSTKHIYFGSEELLNFNPLNLSINDAYGINIYSESNGLSSLGLVYVANPEYTVTALVNSGLITEGTPKVLYISYTSINGYYIISDGMGTSITSYNIESDFGITFNWYLAADNISSASFDLRYNPDTGMGIVLYCYCYDENDNLLGTVSPARTILPFSNNIYAPTTGNVTEWPHVDIEDDHNYLYAYVLPGTIDNNTKPLERIISLTGIELNDVPEGILEINYHAESQTEGREGVVPGPNLPKQVLYSTGWGSLPEQEYYYPVINRSAGKSNLYTFEDPGPICVVSKQNLDRLRASVSIEDGISIIQNFDGALSDIMDMIQRANDLATHYPYSQDKPSILDELNGLYNTLLRVFHDTVYSNLHLFGSRGVGFAFNSYNDIDPRGFFIPDISKLIANEFSNSIQTLTNTDTNTFSNVLDLVWPYRVSLGSLQNSIEYLVNMYTEQLALEQDGDVLPVVYNKATLNTLYEIVVQLVDLLARMANGANTRDDRFDVLHQIIFCADTIEKIRHTLYKDGFYYLCFADDGDSNSFMYRLHQCMMGFIIGDLTTETDWVPLYNTISTLATELQGYLSVDVEDPESQDYQTTKTTFEGWGGTTIQLWNAYNYQTVDGEWLYKYFIGIHAKSENLDIVSYYYDYIQNASISQLESEINNAVQDPAHDLTNVNSEWSTITSALQSDTTSDFITKYQTDITGTIQTIPIIFCITTTNTIIGSLDSMQQGCGCSYYNIYNNACDVEYSTFNSISDCFRFLDSAHYDTGNIDFLNSMAERLLPNQNVDISNGMETEIRSMITERIMNATYSGTTYNYDDFCASLAKFSTGYNYTDWSNIDTANEMNTLIIVYYELRSYINSIHFLRNLSYNYASCISAYNPLLSDQISTFGSIPGATKDQYQSVLTPKGWKDYKYLAFELYNQIENAVTWIGTQTDFNNTNWDPNDPMYNLDDNKLYRTIYITET